MPVIWIKPRGTFFSITLAIAPFLMPIGAVLDSLFMAHEALAGQQVVAVAAVFLAARVYLGLN